MSSAETTHPIEWAQGACGQRAHANGKMIAQIWESHDGDGKWAIWFADDRNLSYQPTASAARSFVEKSVKEAGHGE